VTFTRLVRYALAPLVRPRKRMRKLLEDPRRVAYALVLLLALGALYTLSVQLAWARGFGATVTPFLAIAPERHYAWQRFYQLPLFLVAIIAFAGTARLVAMAFGGRGRFEDAFAVCAVALTLPMLLTMWVPETVIFIAAPPGWAPAGAWGTVVAVFHVARQGAGIAWPLAVIARTLARSERIGGWAAAAVTAVAFLPVAALMAVFIR
jgi:hypothetical protein